MSEFEGRMDQMVGRCLTLRGRMLIFHHRIMKSSFAFVLAFLGLLTSRAGFAQELPFTHYTPESEVNPLPSADVRSVYQDHVGYIWMVVYSSGLLRYDGHQNDRYTPEDGLAGLDVRGVLEDQLGRLWVVSEEGLVVSERP